MSNSTAILRSRTTSPTPKHSLVQSSLSRGVSPKLVENRRSSKSMSPEPRTISPTRADMNRVHEELEKLNIATDVINKLELQLDQARETFREIQTSWTQKLDHLSKKLGTCIPKSRPYYEARMELLKAQQEAQGAALRFERANTMHAVAKQQVALTQESLNRQQAADVDPACLEVLNHHIQRVNDAERERLQSEEEHRRVSCRVEEANRGVSLMEKELKRSIQKSKPYFEARVEFTKVLDDQKALIQSLEAEIKQKKKDYNTSLRNLERISEEIHERRHSLGRRDPGVGSETPDPPPSRKDSNNSDASASVDGVKKTKQSLVYLRRRSKPSISVSRMEDIMQILGANVVTSGDNEDRPRAESMPPDIAVGEKEKTRLNSGVILLAQHLLATSANGKVNPIESNTERKIRAFEFPPEQLDVEYKTIPEGVKPFPTPPETPRPPPPLPSLTRLGSDGNLLLKQRKSLPDGLQSDASSVSSFTLDDEYVERVFTKSPYGLMKEIDNAFDRVQNSAEQSEEDSGCSFRTNCATTMSNDLFERSSASGAEDSSKGTYASHLI